MFCKHKFEFIGRQQRPHYFLWYHNYSDYYYAFKCTKCSKTKKVPITFSQFYETPETVVVSNGRKYKANELILDRNKSA